jgi:hypothetical protein
MSLKSGLVTTDRKSGVSAKPRDGQMERWDYVWRHCLGSRPRNFLVGVLACVLGLAFSAAAQAKTSVATYHNDIKRTGWNPSESILTPSNVTPATFGLITTTTLDDQVDAQPLVVANQTITGKGVHTVVYVATENNSVYAIDASTGSILQKVNLGAPVPMPLGCNNNGPNVGINSTPTIDVETQIIYVMAYTLVAGQPIYRLHALHLQSLAEVAGSPITVVASHTLTNGSKYSFNATYQRQRPALLQSAGNIYAGFGSFCDFSTGSSRGWLLGWNASTLAPLSANELTDRLTSAPYQSGNWFLSSIWMSGYGIADDGDGNIFFVTGNSDPQQATWNSTTNLAESVVKMPQALTSVLDFFTPSNEFTLDQNDYDYASGGVLVLPDQPGPVPHLAVAAGKEGQLFILDRDDMGGFHNDNIPASVGLDGGCWCGPSYYEGSDGIGRVVTSGGSQVETWTINTSNRPALTLEASSPALATTAQDPGFFTTVSSNGTTANTAIIWAIGRPTGSNHQITLYAFNATKSGSSLPQLWSGSAGSWPYVSGNADLVPTVANGMVYVASYKQLAIFGRTAAAGAKTEVKLQQPQAAPEVNPAGALFWGSIKSISDSRIELVLRTGELLRVDLSAALAEGTTVVPVLGENVAVNGQFNGHGVLQARFMWRAKGPQKSWGADRPG